MRYATMVQPHPDKPPHLVGIGETRDDALAAARVWFRAEFDRTSSKDWPGLIALQDQIAISTEEEFATRTGVGLDEWLARMTTAGVAPATAPATSEEDAWVPLTTHRRDRGSLHFLLYCAFCACIFVGVVATARYGATRLLNRQIDSITNSSYQIGGPMAPAIPTFDADAFWGGNNDPYSFDDTQIDGILAQ
jgi:hypothetical protein